MIWTFNIQSFNAEAFLGITISGIHILAICLTVVRLHHRFNISRLWWDDCVAAVASIMDCAALVVFWVGDVEPNNILVYKVGFLCLVAVEWATRIALALSFARIFPPGEKTRNFAISLAILFLFLFIAIVIQTVLFCTNNFAWITTSFVRCDFHGELLYFLIVANVLSDAVLVCSPLYVLRRLRLPDNQKRLIFTCFMGSALVSLACIVTAVFQFVPTSELTGEIRVILGYLEGSVSLFVCNLLVIVTYFYKVFRQRDIEERDTVEEVPTTHNRSQEMYETDRTSQRPPPVGTEEYVTPINFTEISGAYFTDSSDGEVSKTNGERLQATATG